MCGGVEYADGNSFEVDEAVIKETINTGLFDSRGENRMGWWHQTYAEFLAAWYLIQLQTPADQILKLLVHPGDPDGKLVPLPTADASAAFASGSAEVRISLEWLGGYARTAGLGLTVRLAARALVTKWKTDTDLASIRDKEALAKLPDDDRAPFVKFWADVDALIAKLGRGK